jgi:hypothetical protein
MTDSSLRNYFQSIVPKTFRGTSRVIVAPGPASCNLLSDRGEDFAEMALRTVLPDEC